MDNGIHPGISRAVYESVDAVNFSSLKHMARTPMHYRAALLEPQEQTAAQAVGQHAHVSILEPARFEREYVMAPKVDKRTNAGKAEWAAFSAANAGKVLLAEDDYRWVLAMRDAVWAHPVAAEMLRGPGHCEVAAIWNHHRTGMRCKGLLDRIGIFDGWTWVVDVKTCRDASARAFASDAARYDYHGQASWYLDGCNAIAPRERRFAWIAVEKEAPHAVAVYEPDSAALIGGEARTERWLDRLSECRSSDVWPGFDLKVQTLSLPRWATTEEGFYGDE